MAEVKELDKIAKIKIIGVGGGGNNAVNRIISEKVKNVECYLLNTETSILKRANTKNVIQIGKETAKGLGAGANDTIGEQSAIESEEDIKKILVGADMAFITAGMGGGTGTGAAPIVAKLAKEMGILTIGIVTKPFTFEGKTRLNRANRGIEKLKENCDALIVVLNDNLLKVVSNKTSINEAFSMADDILRKGVQSITDLITTVGEINIDFSDVKTILNYQGKGYLGMGTAVGENRLYDAVKLAIENPLTENKIDNAKGVIFNVCGGENLGLSEINSAISLINDKVDEDANIIFGTLIDENLTDEVIVTVIATGISE